MLEGTGWRLPLPDTFIPMVKGTGGGAACRWRRKGTGSGDRAEARAGDKEPRASEDEKGS